MNCFRLRRGAAAWERTLRRQSSTGLISREMLKTGSAMHDASRSLKGRLLLDGGKLHGSFFHRTVVLICQHDAEGAFGLVINRSTAHQIGEAVIADLPETLQEKTLFLGGPVQPSALSYLHSDIYLPDANIMENLNLGHSLETLIELGSSFSTTSRLRVFAGYAGWSPGQLEEEMEREAWVTHPASLDLVFHANPEQLWQSVMRAKGWPYRLLPDAPEDFSRN